MKKRELAVAATGAANLASVQAMCFRAGVEARISEDPDFIYQADWALLPGVGAFGAAAARLKASGLDAALAARVAEGRPTMGICLGMQLFCQESAEAPGARGLGVLPCRVEKFSGSLPLPQLGWNMVTPAEGDRFLRSGWAYFANSYRLAAAPEGYRAAVAVYGETFVAALESRVENADGVPAMLFCQFHPELSGPWGLDLFARWMGAADIGAKEAAL